MGRYAEAIRAFTRAAELFEAVGDAPNLAVAYCNLAHCFKTMATAEVPDDYQPQVSHDAATASFATPLLLSGSGDALSLQQRTQ